MRKPKKMTRQQFESKFQGEWKVERTLTGRSYRQNGKLMTGIRDGRKYFSDGKNTVSSATWGGLWKVLNAG